jgi:hypothetical protein
MVMNEHFYVKFTSLIRQSHGKLMYDEELQPNCSASLWHVFRNTCNLAKEAPEP